METIQKGTESPTNSKKIERSKAYPSLSLDQAFIFTQEIAKSFTSSQVINREDIAAVLKKKTPTIERDIAAAVQYGLFTREKGGYLIAPIFKQLSYPTSDKEKARDFIQCFCAPKLFKELIDKYDNHALPDLVPILIRFHGISASAASIAEDSFKRSGIFCKVINDQGILNVNQALQNLNDGSVQFAEVVDNPPRHEVFRLPPAETPPPSEDGEKVKIRLSEKKYAYLIYPDGINRTDIEIIKKEIEKLELMLSDK